MSATVFTWPGGTVTASCDLSSLATTRPSRVVVHEILDDAPVYTARPAGARTATLTAYCTSHTDGRALEEAYAAGIEVAIADAAAPELLHATVATGDIALRRHRVLGWVLEVDVSEVA